MNILIYYKVTHMLGAWHCKYFQPHCCHWVWWGLGFNLEESTTRWRMFGSITSFARTWIFCYLANHNLVMLDENVIMALIKGFKVVRSMLTMMNMKGLPMAWG